MARSDGDNFVLNGTKAWISNSHQASGFVLFATTDKSKKHKGAYINELFYFKISYIDTYSFLLTYFSI